MPKKKKKRKIKPCTFLICCAGIDTDGSQSFDNFEDTTVARGKILLQKYEESHPPRPLTVDSQEIHSDTSSTSQDVTQFVTTHAKKAPTLASDITTPIVNKRLPARKDLQNIALEARVNNQVIHAVRTIADKAKDTGKFKKYDILNQKLTKRKGIVDNHVILGKDTDSSYSTDSNGYANDADDEDVDLEEVKDSHQEGFQNGKCMQAPGKSLTACSQELNVSDSYTSEYPVQTAERHQRAFSPESDASVRYTSKCSAPSPERGFRASSSEKNNSVQYTSKYPAETVVRSLTASSPEQDEVILPCTSEYQARPDERYKRPSPVPFTSKHQVSNSENASKTSSPKHGIPVKSTRKYQAPDAERSLTASSPERDASVKSTRKGTSSAVERILTTSSTERGVSVKSTRKCQARDADRSLTASLPERDASVQSTRKCPAPAAEHPLTKSSPESDVSVKSTRKSPAPAPAPAPERSLTSSSTESDVSVPASSKCPIRDNVLKSDMTKYAVSVSPSKYSDPNSSFTSSAFSPVTSYQVPTSSQMEKPSISRSCKPHDLNDSLTTSATEISQNTASSDELSASEAADDPSEQQPSGLNKTIRYPHPPAYRNQPTSGRETDMKYPYPPACLTQNLNITRASKPGLPTESFTFDSREEELQPHSIQESDNVIQRKSRAAASTDLLDIFMDSSDTSLTAGYSGSSADSKPCHLLDKPTWSHTSEDFPTRYIHKPEARYTEADFVEAETTKYNFMKKENVPETKIKRNLRVLGPIATSVKQRTPELIPRDEALLNNNRMSLTKPGSVARQLDFSQPSPSRVKPPVLPLKPLEKNVDDTGTKKRQPKSKSPTQGNDTDMSLTPHPPSSNKGSDAPSGSRYREARIKKLRKQRQDEESSKPSSDEACDRLDGKPPLSRGRLSPVKLKRDAFQPEWNPVYPYSDLSLPSTASVMRESNQDEQMREKTPGPSTSSLPPPLPPADLLAPSVFRRRRELGLPPVLAKNLPPQQPGIRAINVQSTLTTSAGQPSNKGPSADQTRMTARPRTKRF